jgi:WD40-like Beta Propeller Repeat
MSLVWQKEGFVLLIQSERRIVLSLLCILGLTFLVGCASKPNRFEIIFISDNGVAGTSDIYRIPDNTQNKVEQLTFTPNIGEYQLLVSEKGDKIIFEAGPYESLPEPSELAIEGFRHIYLLDTADKKLVDITNVLVKDAMVWDGFTMDWSSNQNQFVVNNGRGLELINFDGTNQRDIPIPSLGENPNIKGIEWSPDGKELILVREETREVQPGWGLFVYDLRNGELRQLTNYQAGCYESKWSPTSQQVAVTCQTYAGPNTDMLGPSIIHILNPENPDQSYGNLALSSCWDTSWSLNGQQLAFECDKVTNQEGLFIVNSDGSGFHEVKLGNLSNPAFLRYPTWSPDDTQIIYVAGTDYQHTNIYSVNVDGSNNHPLTHQIANYHDLSVYPLP